MISTQNFIECKGCHSLAQKRCNFKPEMQDFAVNK